MRADPKREQPESTRELMNANVRDCLVEGYRSLMPGLELPDPDDQKVLATGRPLPGDAALKLLSIADKHPEVLLES